MSLLVQLLGLALIVAGAAVLFGVGWALFTAGVCSLALGVALEVSEGVSDGPSEASDA